MIGLFMALSSGCVVPEGGYGYDEGVGIGVDYYEPYGVDYGDWSPSYLVGPVQAGGYRPDRDGPTPSHAYRPAPAFHSIPSIPSRSGGSRGR